VKGAVGHLLPLVETEEGVSLSPAFATRTLSNAIEALVAAGELERAQSVVDRLDEHARSMAVPSAIAAAARCRALVLAQDATWAQPAPPSRERRASMRVSMSRSSSPARTWLKARSSVEQSERPRHA
jgi:hypothetical protein